jgi:hypothetical protein
MPLDLPATSRFARPGTEVPLPDAFVDETYSLLLKIVGPTGDRQTTIEHFKKFFCLAVGRAHYWSSSTDFAEYDLRQSLRDAKVNPALFLEALFDGIETLRSAGRQPLPDVSMINDLLRHHEVPYEIDPPTLARLVEGQRAVRAPAVPATLDDEAAALLRASMARAEELLGEQRPREAVQETLWMLESFVTSFRGTALPAGEIRGKYFNEIAKELRRNAPGTTLERVVEWLGQLHGYLSSPTGGGVRHGIDLSAGNQITAAEGRLFVNLVLSYLSFLLNEHERLASHRGV